MSRLIRPEGGGCSHKRLFRSRKLALHAAGMRGRSADVKLHVYHCLDCHGYHLTKMGQPRAGGAGAAS